MLFADCQLALSMSYPDVLPNTFRVGCWSRVCRPAAASCGNTCLTYMPALRHAAVFELERCLSVCLSVCLRALCCAAPGDASGRSAVGVAQAFCVHGRHALLSPVFHPTPRHKTPPATAGPSACRTHPAHALVPVFGGGRSLLTASPRPWRVLGLRSAPFSPLC
jgi:hypothetical protein